MNKVSPEEDSYHLDMSLYNELRHMFTTNETIKHCYDTLERFLFQNIKIKGATEVLKEFIFHFSEFCTKVLKYLWILGWCPYTIVKIKSKVTNEDISIPKVVPVEYIFPELVVNKSNFTHKLNFYDLNRDKLKKNIYYVSSCDIEDISNQTLINSPLQSILPEYRFLEQLKRFTIQSEFTRSNPAVFLVKKDPKNNEVTSHRYTSDTNDEIQGLHLVDPVEEDEAIPSRIAMFKEASDDVVKNVHYHNQQMEDMVRFQNESYYDLGLGFRPQTMNNLFVCPPGMTLAAPPRMPEVKSDILTLAKKFSSTVFLSLGMPETIFGFGSQNNVNMAGRAATRTTEIRKDINVMDINSFDATLRKYHLIFSNLFSDIYFSIFKKRIKPEAISFEPPVLYKNYTTYMLAEIQLKGEKEQMKIHQENEKIQQFKNDNKDNGSSSSKKRPIEEDSQSNTNKKSKTET